MALTDAELLALSNQVSAAMDAVEAARQNFRQKRLAIYQAQQDTADAKTAMETAERQLEVLQRQLIVALRAR